MTSVDTFVKYYDAISTAEFDSIAECFDTPSKLISLYGTVNHFNREQIKDTYAKIIKNLEWTINIQASRVWQGSFRSS